MAEVLTWPLENCGLSLATCPTVIPNSLTLHGTASAIFVIVTLFVCACAPARPPRVAAVRAAAGLPQALTWLGEFTRPAAAVTRR